MLNKETNKITRKNGFSVIEIVIAAAIIVTIVTAATNAWQIYFKISRISTTDTQATMLTEEFAEALNYIRDLGWSKNIATLTPGTIYYMYWNNGSDTYGTSTTPVLVNDAYYIGVVFSPVSRNTTNRDIVPTGSANSGEDIHTHMAVISIYASTTPSQTLMQSSLYLHDI
jgi:type II secretory pathway pseudopilin PulG